MIDGLEESSQEVEETGHLVIGLTLVLLGIGANLMGVHAHHGNLDRACEVKVVVAQVVGGCFEVVLVKGTCVIGNTIKHWLGCGNSGFVGNQVEIEQIISLLLDDTGIDASAWARVQDVLLLLVEESVLNVSVDQAEDDLGLVPLSSGLKHVSDDLDFVILNLLGHGWPAHTISVYDNLLGKCLGLLVEIANGFIDEVLDNLSSLNGYDDLLHFSACFAWVLSKMFLSNLRELVFKELSEALTQVFVRCG